MFSGRWNVMDVVMSDIRMGWTLDTLHSFGSVINATFVDRKCCPARVFVVTELRCISFLARSAVSCGIYLR